eukprot:6190819-Pleurochrysis_carterae.AAC.1
MREVVASGRCGSGCVKGGTAHPRVGMARHAGKGRGIRCLALVESYCKRTLLRYCFVRQSSISFSTLASAALPLLPSRLARLLPPTVTVAA